MTALPLALFLLQDTATPSGPLAGSHSNALVDMVRNSGPTALTVLVILLIASVLSWAIIITKWRAFNDANVQGRRFIRAFRKSGRLSEIAAIADQFKPSPLVAVFHEIHDEYQRQAGGRGTPPNPQALERAAQTAASESLTIMERRMTWLATTAQCAPFVGLFGTVMGIIDAFHSFATSGGAATIRAVGPGIAEALITTAAGLVVAVPAVVGYNQLTQRLKEFAARMDDFGRELLNAIENAALVTSQHPTSQQAAPLPPYEETRRRP